MLNIVYGTSMISVPQTANVGVRDLQWSWLLVVRASLRFSGGHGLLGNDYLKIFGGD